ncbi:hypothetical protein RyT2_07030 [Pseudolactococcus yaeyamensis]
MEALWELRALVTCPTHQVTEHLSYQPYKSTTKGLSIDYEITFFHDAQFYHYAIGFTDHQGKIILLDEFDNSFHLLISMMLLSLINSEFQYSQFILTSHEISLMDHNMRND